MSNRLLSANEVAERLNVHINTVYCAVADRKLNARKIGRIYRFSEGDLESYLESMQTVRQTDSR